MNAPQTVAPAPDSEMVQYASRMAGLEDLPIGRAEIELSAPATDLVLADDLRAATKIMALVRLHSYPVGVTLLDGDLGLSWEAHAPAVWAALGGEVNRHLAADGYPAVESLAELAVTTDAPTLPGCLHRRESVLATAPFATVAVATRNRPDSLRGCLEALQQLSYPSYEIVVVDNDPTTDETANMVKEIFGPRVRYIRENRRGVASAHNCALEAARGEIIAFVDDDVVVDTHWLTGIAEGFAAGDDVGCVTGLILPAELVTPAQLLLEKHGGFDKGFEQRVFDTGRNRPQDKLFPFTAGRLGSGANMAFHTAKLRRLGGFDAALGIGTFARGGDDLAGFFQVVVAGHQLVYQPGAVAWHRHHREMSALQNQSYGYGMGLGAFLASSLWRNPRMLAQVLRRLPSGFTYAFSDSSTRNEGRYDGWPPELARLERRGLLLGPGAYAVSRWRSRRWPASDKAVDARQG
ncbi:glycosyltransferase family 2 protein [Mycolicibacterium brisbanense]|uniref:Glycosyl transferase family 2 n=1 Tax=Mycolicibacterium brisbanense TaxID=146020 RepID=A0A124DZB9_9MYCO|nr:glycosyltransferase family A protein [Mycolicibacterium brisbanense]MCV7160694.1 glycosyltransferase family 2 protein [Mycolicibacterium brisbanense]GAS86898.1 glycosyl transferase family 2 [Mycolicibacterium brisbanense]